MILASRRALTACLLAWGLLLCGPIGCAPKFNLFGDRSAPLEESTLRGSGADKVLLVQVRGVIASDPNEGLWRRRPGLVQEVVSGWTRPPRTSASRPPS